uniref:Uncharacterized protein n=1 Tax=Arundo donax TaxID=35708 RepID=A0A0A9AZ61_ARUDO
MKVPQTHSTRVSKTSLSELGVVGGSFQQFYLNKLAT